MTEFDHIDDTNSCRLIEPVTCTTVSKHCLAISWHPCFVGIIAYFIDIGTVKNRSTELKAKFRTCPAEHCFINLTKVHTGRHSKRVEDNIHRCTITQERHILFSYNLGNNTFITMSSGHFVAHSDFSLLGNVNFCKLHNAIRKFVTDFDFVESPLAFCRFFLICNTVIVDKVSYKKICVFV